ncbi:hypothetical protein U1Q18_001534 [Sarracenia purpurea var. burkii]
MEVEVTELCRHLEELVLDRVIMGCVFREGGTDGCGRIGMDNVIVGGEGEGADSKESIEAEERFDGTDERFGGTDEKFDGTDERFGGIDETFDGTDERFDGTDEIFGEIVEIFGEIDEKFGELHLNVGGYEL